MLGWLNGTHPWYQQLSLSASHALLRADTRLEAQCPSLIRPFFKHTQGWRQDDTLSHVLFTHTHIHTHPRGGCARLHPLTGFPCQRSKHKQPLLDAPHGSYGIVAGQSHQPVLTGMKENMLASIITAGCSCGWALLAKLCERAFISMILRFYGCEI